MEHLRNGWLGKMMTYEELEDIQPYALEKQKKKEFLLKNLKRLILHH